MKQKIVRLEIQDDEIQDITYLINPDKDKLAKLKHMIEHRFDYQYDTKLSDEEIENAEEFCDSIWDHIYNFINANFIVLNIDEVYEIQY